MPLTNAAVRNAKPADKARKLFDGGGLYVVTSIAPAFCKPFAVSCTASRRILFVIGRYLDRFFRPKRFA